LLTQQLGRPVVNARRIRDIVLRGEFDVVNFHNVSLLGGPGLFKYAGDAVSLYMAHEHWLVCPMHVLWRHGRELCTGRECLRCTLSYRRPPQLWRYTGLLERELERVDAVIAMSEFSREKHREFGLKRDMEVLPYFLPDADTPALGEQASPHPRPYFFFAGRLERIKGLDDLIPVFRRFPAADLIIAGAGEYEASLRALAAGMPNVVFLGRVPGGELGRYYRHAVAAVMPSICYETFGIVLIEAFRQGTPVIARRLGPMSEIVTQSQGGELFTTSEELEASMRRFAGDSALRDRHGRAAYRASMDLWSEHAVIPRYLDIVRRAAERRRNRRVLEALAPAEVA
jgi:glycosyltransferase involved in cell wall biosynthesis